MAESIPSALAARPGDNISFVRIFAVEAVGVFEMTKDEKITLELSGAEALVFFEWLKSREDRADSDGEAQSIAAENIVLWRLEAQLDKRLVEPFCAEYEELVEKARRRVLESAVADEGESTQ